MHYLLTRSSYLVNDESCYICDSDVQHWYLNRRIVLLFKYIRYEDISV